MMPAASNKVEQKTSLEAQDPLKLALVMLDKKVRNLDKRKAKLDAIRTKAASGAVLEKEQQDAIQHFEEVSTNLEFAKELQKQMNGIAADAEKLQKKQAKREKQERTASELRRITEVLQVQTTLDCLGSEKVREHFKTGKFGAVVLTEDNLSQLDELYQLISPSRESSTDFNAALSSASEHIISLLEARDRPAVGSTYKELRELIVLINDCGYFERARAAEQTEEEHVEEQKEEETEAVEELPSSLPLPSETFHEVTEPEEEPALSGIHQAAELEDARLSHPQVMQNSMAAEPAASYFASTPTSSAYQTTQAQPQPMRVRPIDEIVSAVQGTFNFLQESMIDVDSPHIDPAVVAAQPMIRPPSVPQPQSNMLPPSAYPSASFPDPSSISVDQQQPSPTHTSDVQDALTLSQQNMTQSKLDYGSGQAFGQANLSHSQNLPSMGETLFQSTVEDSSAAAVVVNQQRGHSMIGQQIGAGEPPSQFEIPPSIPMPPSQSQEGSQITPQEKKFQMNASAPVFQSMYSQTNTVPAMSGQALQQNTVQQPQPQPQSSQPQNQQEGLSSHPSTTVGDFPSAQPNFAQAAGDFSQAAGNGFPNNGFQRGGRNGGPPNFRGGQRGGRGANNSGAMQNGFNNRPSSGNNRGGRGSSSYQGFPPRNDYRPDGYQGFNNNGFSPSNYQKRGGPGGINFPRGGANNRVATGMRGGAPRSGGPPRGGNTRGGMNRPVSAQ
ncbi:caprin-1-like isoform X1 [Pomacea canaliculata]|uniref:caprin-1-like isoform X1 n=1 Tax=Pomacea canaliculata TaxID=400727 RepID=UPI000D733222|nr:caprin-1-like isoform X1 [Pomacea canaliculata]